MTMSSSKTAIRSDQTVRVYDFVPPDQSGAASRRSENKADSETAAGAKSPPADWRPASLEEADYQESTGILEGARTEARQMMFKAKQLTEEILQEARDQAEQIRNGAAEEGYRDGYEKGVKEGVERAVTEHGTAMESRIEEFGQEIRRALDAVDEAKQICLRNYLEELKNCSVAVAEKVIHISIRSSGEIIKRMIIAETERLKKTAWVKIYMEKMDYEMMLETDADVIGELSRLSDNIKFIVMDKENSGNCIIEMPDEIIDISVDTQLDNIKEILQNIGV